MTAMFQSFHKAFIYGNKAVQSNKKTRTLLRARQAALGEVHF
jgi:hypothetical protein